ncbi:MAG: GNAT family N-acetyltransferase, partial [Candidatus Eremiobacteraeota bacterium]|nr:GNAT family N-acetyltransferase [Candidatus Eremiobacteraeota bacterium]
MQLREITPQVYVREVLPLTASLWGGARTFDAYVAQTLEIARGPYGRRYYRTLGLYDGTTLVASFKRYERTIRHETQSLRAVGFGAVFTPEEYRGRGYASVMVATALDAARADGHDVAFLFSDIRPQFYTALGFTALPSRRFLLRADTLPSMRLQLTHLKDDDWRSIRRVYERGDEARSAGFVRSASVWSWIATKMRHRSEHPTGQPANLVVRRSGRIVAYVFGVRAPRLDAYLLDEFAFADTAGAAAIPALLRAAAG